MRSKKAMRQRPFFIHRFLGLFLSASLALPHPTFALRPLQPEQNVGLEEDLARSLTDGPSTSESSPLGAGLEEGDVIDEVVKTLSEVTLDSTPQDITAAIESLGKLTKAMMSRVGSSPPLSHPFLYDAQKLSRLARVLVQGSFRPVPPSKEKLYGRLLDKLDDVLDLFSNPRLATPLFKMHFLAEVLKEEDRLIAERYQLQEDRRHHESLAQQLKEDGMVVVALPGYVEFKQAVLANSDVELDIPVLDASPIRGIGEAESLLIIIRSFAGRARSTLSTSIGFLVEGHTHPRRFLTETLFQWFGLRLPPLFPSGGDTQHAQELWQMEKPVPSFIFRVTSPEYPWLLVYEGEWRAFSGDEQVAAKLLKLGVVRATAAGLEETYGRVKEKLLDREEKAARGLAAELWSGIAVTPAYEQKARNRLVAFAGLESSSAIPLVARGGLPFLVFTASGLEEERIRAILDDLNVSPDQYQIRPRNGMIFSKVLAGLEQEFPSRTILSADSSQPNWLQGLLAGLEEAGVIPLDDFTPASQATQRYLGGLA